MDFKIQIHCHKCKCKFELRADIFEPSEHFQCPNCAQPFPDEQYKEICSGIKHLKSVPESLGTEDNDMFCGASLGFELSVKEYNVFLRLK